MKSMTLRHIDDALYDRLVAMAKGNRRSLQQQVLHILEAEAAVSREGIRLRASRWRARLRNRVQGDVVRDVRELRDG